MKLDLAVGQIWEVEAEDEEFVWKFEIVGKVIRKRRNCWIAVKKYNKIPRQLDVAVFNDNGMLMNRDGDIGGMLWFLTDRVEK
jgi:hypothetical protein